MPQIDPARAAELLATPEGCRVLDAAAASLVGWVKHDDGVWSPPGTTARYRPAFAPNWAPIPPAFTTAGDVDPYARWDLVAAMWKALPRDNGEVWAHEDASSHHEHLTNYHAVGNTVTARVAWAVAETLHRALVLALAAAGLLEIDE